MRTKIIVKLIILGFISNNLVSAQNLKMCAYKDYITEYEIQKACGQNSYINNQKAERVVDNILLNVGLFRNFIIKECPNIQNAIAATVTSPLGSFERYIIYDQEFLDRVSGSTGTDWSAISILAHEIGHHLNGHTLIEGITNHDMELQADEFSGFVLAKMGASLEESLGAIKKYGTKDDTKSHPNKQKRIQAISRGWNNGSTGKQKIEVKNVINVYDYNESEVKSYISMAGQYYENQKYSQAASAFLNAFKYSAGLEIDFLYYAASSAVQANDYVNALKYYEALLDVGYEGDDIKYYAVDKKTGEKELFNNVTSRDAAIKGKKYTNPTNGRGTSKRPEILKNIALIYVSLGKNDKALAHMNEAREANPDNIGLILSEANVYLKIGDKYKFKQLIQLAVTKEPKNPELQFNLGVLAAESGDSDSAKKYYQNAIDLNPRYSDAILNMAVLILDRESKIIKEMNSLGTSKADDKRYEELRAERTKLYGDAVPYLQRVLEIDPKNLPAAETLMNMYAALGETKKYKETKALVEYIKARN